MGPSIFCTTIKKAHLVISLCFANYCLYFFSHWTLWKQNSGWYKHADKEVLLLLLGLWYTFLLWFLVFCIYILKIGPNRHYWTITTFCNLNIIAPWVVLPASYYCSPQVINFLLLMFFHLVNFIEMLGLSQQTPREGLLLVNGTKSWKLKLQKRSKALQPPAEPLGGKAGLPPPPLLWPDYYSIKSPKRLIRRATSRDSLYTF